MRCQSSQDSESPHSASAATQLSPADRTSNADASGRTAFAGRTRYCRNRIYPLGGRLGLAEVAAPYVVSAQPTIERTPDFDVYWRHCARVRSRGIDRPALRPWT